MKCELCGEKESEYQCIDCGKHICSSCSVICGLKKRNYCVKKMGDIVIYECKGVFCKKCADFTLVHHCIECNVTFCNAVLDDLIYECPKCLNKVCPDCKDLHKSKCTTKFDREEALSKLYEKIASDYKDK